MGLETAQAVGLINSAVLWQGQAVTLVGVSGTNAYIETSDSSQMVSLAELDVVTASARLVSQGDTFRAPGVFRHQPVEACSAEPAEVDPSLNVCLDPSNPDNLEDILRQAGSSDPTQREEGRGALREAARQARSQGREREFNNRVQEALEEIGEENPCDLAGAEQAYAEVRNAPAPSGSNGASNGGSNAGAGNGGSAGNGGGAPVAYAGNGTPLAAANGNGLEGDAASPVVAFASLGSLENPGFDFPDPTGGVVFASLIGGPHVEGSDGGPATDAVPAVHSSSLPAVFDPFTVPVPAFLPASMAGALNAPRSGDASREVAFFQAFFGPALTERPSSDLMALLTHPTPAFAPKVYEVRRAVAEVIRTHNARYGSASPLDRDASLPIVFRYNPERRRIEVSIDAPVSAAAGNEGSPFDGLRGPFRSLAGFRLGSSDHLRGDEFGFGPIVAYVPVPAQYLQGVRLGNDMILARADGHTDRHIDRPARRDSANHQHGGSHGGDREERDPRGGRGGRGEHRDGDEELYAMADDESGAVAA